MSEAGRRRNLLHKNKLEAFRKWITHGRGYYEAIPKGTPHEYEVLRLVRHDPAGDDPPVIFYRRGGVSRRHPEGWSEHITVPASMVTLVEEFLDDTVKHRSKKKSNCNLPVSGRP